MRMLALVARVDLEKSACARASGEPFKYMESVYLTYIFKSVAFCAFDKAVVSRTCLGHGGLLIRVIDCLVPAALSYKLI